MTELKLNKKEIEQLIKNQFKCSSINWDSNNNVILNINLDDVQKQEIDFVKREVHYPFNSNEMYKWIYPIYVSTQLKPVPGPHWRIDKTSSSILYNDSMN